MEKEQYANLNAMQMDALREVANIGTGNAITSLSSMLMRPIRMQVPRVSFLDYTAVTEEMGGPEAMMAGLMLTLRNDINGMMMFLLKEEFAHMVLNTLLGQSFTNFADVDDMGLSAMQEIGNIMAGSYVNAISELTGLTIQLSPPDICIDMIGSILSVPAIYFADISEQVILIENDFAGDNDTQETSNVLLIPETDSLETLFSKLGLAP